MASVISFQVHLQCQNLEDDHSRLVSYSFSFLFHFKGSETPAMPTSTTPLPSGNTVKVRRVASMNNLTEAQASSIGLANCYHR